MKLFTITLYATMILFFTSCGDNTETPLSDISHIEIDSPTTTMYATDAASLSATVYYTDATTADVTGQVTWSSSDSSIASVSGGNIVAGNSNGGDANITIKYRGLTASPSLVSVIGLTGFSITNADINTTGEHILQAKGNFSDGTTEKVIVKNIVWTATNSATIEVANDIATITVSTGDTNVTATMFEETNSSSSIAPETVSYTVN